MIKQGVDIRGLKPEMVIAYVIACNVYNKYSALCTITSALDGVHSVGSLHGKGYALDLRTNNIAPDFVQLIVVDLRVALGSLFDVVLEKDHIHVEFDPKEV